MRYSLDYEQNKGQWDVIRHYRLQSQNPGLSLIIVKQFKILYES
jgi:hypothetical protein